MRSSGSSNGKGGSKEKGSGSSATSGVTGPVAGPQRLPGYSFNNGNETQPILRARECDSSPGHVGLNFNFWMDHNYLVNDQVKASVLDSVQSTGTQAESKFLRNDVTDGVSNALLVLVQNVDPRELNDSIKELPFLGQTSCMPIRHVKEEEAPLVALDESPPGAQAAMEQQWQHGLIDHCHSLLLWMDRPSVSLSEVAGLSLPELLAKYIVTFQGVHTLWQDEVVFFADITSVTEGAQFPTTVKAFQDLARQKLLYSKDAPIIMTHMFAELTKAPQQGDIYGRCSRAKARETGMFLYRASGHGSTASPRLTLVWHRNNSIDVMEASASPALPSSAEDTTTTSPQSAPLTFVKLPPAKIVSGGKSRFLEQGELVLTLAKAVLPDAKLTSVAPTVEIVGMAEGRVAGQDGADAAVSAAVSTDTPVPYFSTALHQQLTTQFSDPKVKSALEKLVLSRRMLDLMGFATTREGGCEGFLHTSEWFYEAARKPSPPPTVPSNKAPRGDRGGAAAAHRGVQRGGAGSAGGWAMDVEDGEEVESDAEEGEEGEVSAEEEDVGEAVMQTRPTADEPPSPSRSATEGYAPCAEGNGLNTKKYFTDEAVPASGEASDSSDNDDAALARVMESNLRKRKAQRAAMTHEDSDNDGEGDEENSTSAPEELPIKKSRTDDPSDGLTTQVVGADTTVHKKHRQERKPAMPLVMSPLPVRPPMPLPRFPAGGRPPLPPMPPPIQGRPPPPTPDTAAAGTGAMTTEAEAASQTSQPIVVPYAPTLVPPYSVCTPLEVCALDCEMCTTAAGLVLTRLTVLCPVNGVIYDTLVKPELEITDYHTEFSGITKEALVSVTTTLQDVQRMLSHFVSDRTIIVGHSLDTDLKVLQLIHHRVIDTSALFPHPSGLPYKHALKRLAKECLLKDIQDGKEGHDSVQDAAVALELALLKAVQVSRGEGRLQPWADEPVPKCSVFETLLLTSQRDVSISVHGVPGIFDDAVVEWERAAFGYRPESQSCVAAAHCCASLQRRLADLESTVAGTQGPPSPSVATEIERIRHALKQIHGERHSRNEVCVEQAVRELRTLSQQQQQQQQQQTGQRSLLTVVELLCNHDDDEEEETTDVTAESSGSIHEDSDSEGYEKESPLTGLARVDDQVRRLYEAAPRGTLLYVVTQGSLIAYKLLASQKMRNRWEVAQVKRKQSLVGQCRVLWDPVVDEGRLAVAAAHATAGAVFVARK